MQLTAEDRRLIDAYLEATGGRGVYDPSELVYTQAMVRIVELLARPVDRDQLRLTWAALVRLRAHLPNPSTIHAWRSFP